MATILVVDDDAAVCSGLAFALESLGHDSLIAADAQRGRELLQAEPVDCLLTDWRMPGEDGLSLARWTREVRPTMPVVLLSAFVTSTTVAQAVAAGCTTALAKPIDLDRLATVLQRLTAGGAPAATPAPPPVSVSTATDWHAVPPSEDLDADPMPRQPDAPAAAAPAGQPRRRRRMRQRQVGLASTTRHWLIAALCSFAATAVVGGGLLLMLH